MWNEQSQHGFIIRCYPYKVPNTKGEFVIEAFAPSMKSAGSLFYIENDEEISIALIEVQGIWLGQGCSDDMMTKLFEVSKGKRILSGQLNQGSYRMLHRMQDQGLLTLLPPPERYDGNVMFEIKPKK